MPRLEGLEDRHDVQCALWVIKWHVKLTSYGQGKFLICQPTSHTRCNNKELIKVLTRNACKRKSTNKLSKETMNAMETRTSSLRKANKL